MVLDGHGWVQSEPGDALGGRVDCSVRWAEWDDLLNCLRSL